MRRRLITFAAVLAVAMLGFAPASASDLCYDVNIDVAGNVVQEADCIEF